MHAQESLQNNMRIISFHNTTSLYLVSRTLGLILFWLLFVPGPGIHAQTRYGVTSGTITFVSDAPLERITATSRTLKGVVEASNRTFAFTIDIASFQGFNSPLQRVHFNENYMESGDYPVATFTGKFIEDVDLSADGTYDIRVKGKLNIHGVEKERIIKSSLRIDHGTMFINSRFTVLLEDHEIRIPKVVLQKISQVVNVEVTATLSSLKT
ncbi:MAG TPA: YceI family protein [Saprospiraceae bacterium]|nr:YceI family protein [Saprospiraceae bacterium]